MPINTSKKKPASVPSIPKALIDQMMISIAKPVINAQSGKIL